MDPNQNDDQNAHNQGMPADDGQAGGQTTPDPAVTPDTGAPEPMGQPEGSAPEAPPPPPAMGDDNAGQGGGGSDEPGTDTNPAA